MTKKLVPVPMVFITFEAATPFRQRVKCLHYLSKLRAQGILKTDPAQGTYSCGHRFEQGFILTNEDYTTLTKQPGVDVFLPMLGDITFIEPDGTYGMVAFRRVVTTGIVGQLSKTAPNYGVARISGLACGTLDIDTAIGMPVEMVSK